MNYRQLGRSSLELSEIGLGCMSLPMQDETACLQIIDRAIELGINFFDTADLYNKGENEIIVGRALKHKRKQMIIATKVGNQWRKDGSGWDWNPGKSYILESVEESLRRLQADYIDLYQLHGGTIDDPIDEAIEAFELLQQQGKIRYYGISSIRPNVIREYVSRSNIVSVMMQYSLADRRPEESMLDLLAANHIGVLSRGALGQGMLVNKPAKDYLGHSATEIKHAAQVIGNLSNASRSSAGIATRLVLQHQAITSAVVGCSKLLQLNEIAGSSAELTAAEVSQLRQLLPGRNYEQHR